MKTLEVISSLGDVFIHYDQMVGFALGAIFNFLMILAIRKFM